jgi:serine/threonine-protein kinase
MRRALNTAMVVWSAFFALDLLVVAHLGVGSFLFFAVLRLAVLVVMLAARLLAVPDSMTLRARTIIDLAVYTSASGAIAVMCIPFWGIASPYACGICLVLVHRTLAANESWRRGLLMNGIPVAAYPLTMFLASFLDASIARQMHDTRAIMIFAISLSFVFGTAALASAGGHMVWSLRQAVSEARRLGHYKLTRPIGSGATGDVWLAHHAALKRDVAVKILRPEARNDIGISRFEREAYATAELRHPNTVRIFDFGITEDGLWYYAMELLEGETLTDLVGREGPLPPARTIDLALQAARALSEAHAHGIVHRDVKPSNLFVMSVAGERDFVKVLDFGIARFFRRNTGSDATLTTEGEIVGTPAYMSPEAVLGLEVDARADAYAMGAVMYFMLTGRPPFESSDEGAIGVLMAHVNNIPELPSVRRGAEIAPDLETVVMRCLEKAPAARYADGMALVAALTACQKTLRSEAAADKLESVSEVQIRGIPSSPMPSQAITGK